MSPPNAVGLAHLRLQPLIPPFVSILQEHCTMTRPNAAAFHEHKTLATSKTHAHYVSIPMTSDSSQVRPRVLSGLPKGAGGLHGTAVG